MTVRKKLQNEKISFPIDMVYLWVDGNDPQHYQKRIKTANAMGLSQNQPMNNLCRFYDNEELKFSLRSLENYANWIRNVYIVTDNQVPSWLNLNNPRVHIIDHKDIIPHDALPTFNSNAIEHCIVNIPDLSEHFLYGNDDMFFWKGINPSDFFDYKTGKVKLYVLGQIGAADNLFRIAMDNARLLLLKKFGTNYTSEMHHNIDAYLKSNMLECQKEFQREIDVCVNNHFRAESDVCRTIYTGYALATGKGVCKEVKRSYGKWWQFAINFVIQNFSKYSKYFDVSDVTNDDYLIHRLKKYHCKLFCINDTEDATDENRKLVHKSLVALFPNKSQFEK